jgi:hypothetical protein
MFAARNMMFARAFSPLSLAPSLWLSDTGSDPAQWADLSGNGRHATQATAANQPAIIAGELNGRQVRRFDGSNDFLTQSTTTLSNVSGCSLFTVRKFGALPTTQRPIIRINVPSVGPNRIRVALIGGVPTSGKAATYARRDFTNEVSPITATSSADVSTSDFQIQTGIINYSSGAVAQYVNGSSDGSGTLPTTGSSQTVADETLLGLEVPGGTAYFQGDIAEILVFPTALSTTNRQAVERYLGSKWGISVA